ncbi:hypothetical protein MASR1M32_13380 [Rhodobacter sp.]
MTQSLTIAVAGAGIGGLAAAALLAPAHDVTVYDQFDAPRPVGSGLVLQPVGVRVLDLCGAGDQARALGARITRMEGDEVTRGRRILDVSYDRPGGPVHGIAIHRAALLARFIVRPSRKGRGWCRRRGSSRPRRRARGAGLRMRKAPAMAPSIW